MNGVTIFLDLDGVLADFHEAARAAHHGLSYTQMNEQFGEWWTGNRFWKPIKAMGVEFWSEMPVLPWAKELVDLASSLADEWYVVTQPSLDPLSCQGKMIWMKRFFGSDFEEFIITSHKRLLAKGHRTILIDDRHKNVISFARQGGTSILFPSPSNDQPVVDFPAISNVIKDRVKNALHAS